MKKQIVNYEGRLVTKIKLSEKQKEVIRLIREGWELAHSSVGLQNSWIQKGGAGRGGELKDVRFSTLKSIINNGLVIRVKDKTDPFYLTRYPLTELGKTIEL